MKHQFSFYSHEIDFQLEDHKKVCGWIRECVDKHSNKTFSLSYVLSNDEYVRQINNDFLEHDFYTDIITFPLEETEEFIEADIYISIERVKENAAKLDQAFDVELRRVIVHGVLHLLGYADRSEDQKNEMRQKENEMLSLFPS
ncbi:MAG: rRNA maturation RNase YbeY [Chitinophagales bacterium]|nr:rRNA maturation RNase YbeY [Chitinophagales bacterium]